MNSSVEVMKSQSSHRRTHTHIQIILALACRHKTADRKCSALLTSIKLTVCGETDSKPQSLRPFVCPLIRLSGLCEIATTGEGMVEGSCAKSENPIH